jgi:hypothetical protein
MEKNTATESIEFEEITNAPAQQTTHTAEVMSAEDVAKNEIKRFNIADAAIENMKKEYSGLKIASPDDKEGYKKVHGAWQIVRGKRLQVEKVHKLIKGDYLVISRAIDGEKNRLLGLIEPLERELNSELERIDKLVQEEKDRAEREAQARLQGRVSTLIENGISFNGSFYAIGETITVDVVTLKNLKDDEFTQLLTRVQAENKKILDAKAEQARLEQEEREKHERERLELIENNRKLEEQRAELEKQKQEFERVQAEAKKQRTDLRVQILLNSGFSKVEGGNVNGMPVYRFKTNDAGEVSIYEYQFSDLNGDEWDDKFLEIRAQLNRLRTLQAETDELNRQKKEQAEREEKLRAQVAARSELRTLEIRNIFGDLKLDSAGNYFKEFNTEGGPEYFQVIVSELKSMTDEDWGKHVFSLREDFADLTAREAENIRAISAKAEAERLAALSDIERIDLYLDALANLPQPTVNDPHLKAAWNLFEDSRANAITTLIKTLKLVQK